MNGYLARVGFILITSVFAGCSLDFNELENLRRGFSVHGIGSGMS